MKEEMPKAKPSYYDKNYFSYQQKVGKFGGSANAYKFAPYLSAKSRVIDFGCGGGYLLANIKAKEKIGIEVNPIARKNAQKLGIKVVSSARKIPNSWANTIISNHALEHTFSPLSELKALWPKLKKEGRIVFVVPQEINFDWQPGDVNQHLYTWSQMSLGNLFTQAGFKVEEVETLWSQWPPFYFLIKRLVGQKGFQLISEIYGRCQSHLRQVRIVARKV